MICYAVPTSAPLALSLSRNFSILRACLKTFDKNDLEVDNKEKQAGAEDRCINTQAISVGRNTI